MIVRCVSKFFYCCIQSFFCLVFMLIDQFIFYIVKVLKFVNDLIVVTVVLRQLLSTEILQSLLFFMLRQTYLLRFLRH